MNQGNVAGVRLGPSVPAHRSPFSRFLIEALAIVAALLVLGYLPTLRLGGEAAIPAMLAGCGLSLAAALVGTVPLTFGRDRKPQDMIPALLGALALRLVAAIALAVSVALSGLFATIPLLVWMMLSHLGLLVADTRFALAHLRAPGPDGRTPTSEKR